MNPRPSIRVILTPEQTADVIRQAGGVNHHGRVFVALSPGSYPTTLGRLVLNLIECPSMQVANDAVAVATGSATARRQKSTNPASDPPQPIFASK